MHPLQDETSQGGSGSRPETWLEDAIAHDLVLGRLFPQLRRLAASDAPVLISGETGTGRELAARAIHNLSHRAPHPFVVLDCAGASEPLIEAELVGVNGASGGGAPQKIGVFEQAGQGTVLLAEVGELPPRAQEALLRLLDRHEVVRMSSTVPVPAHARCIATTSADLRARIPAGLFRDELHGRLATEVLSLPPLRERRDEIVAVAQLFLDQCCGHLPQAAREMSREAETVLRDYAWPGNLREVRETIEEAAMRARGQRIGVEHLPDRLRRTEERGPLPSLRDVEMRHIQRVLEEARGNQRRASRILGISRWSLSRRLRKYGMQPRSEEQ
jgi:two-component system response regulator AtoC